jgi:hypothetical protein
MGTRTPTRRWLTLHDREPSQGQLALASFVSLLLAMALMCGAVLLAVADWPSPVLRAILAALAASLAVLPLMLASDSASRLLPDRGRGGDRLYWLTTSLIALAVVVVLGALLSLRLRDRPGAANVVRAFAADFGLGLLAGAIAVGLALATSAVFGGLIYAVQSGLGLEGRAARWRRPVATEKHVWARLGHGALLGAAGLLLSAACTALVTTATTNHTGGAEAPTVVEHDPWLTVALPLLAWLVGTAIVWFVLPARVPRFGQGHAREPHRRLRHSTHGTALAICLMVVSVWIAATLIEHRAERKLWAHRHTVPAVSVTPQQWSRASEYLAQRFQPRFLLAHDERWSPTSVSWYLQQSGPASTATRFCGSDGCYRIHGGGCDGADPPASCAPSGTNDPALYYRYYDSSDPGTKPAGVSWKLIQYWIFYNYDSLQAGAITQWHQADWEQVSVLVRRDGTSVRPAEVAFSEHCYGARLPAERIEWADGSHPVVFVGNGSHANYPRPVSVPVRELRCSLGLTPRYFGVAGLFFVPAFDGTSLEIPVAYLLGLRDHATRGRPSPALRLVSLPGTPAGSSSPRFWGPDNNISFLGSGAVQTGAGPPAPARQGPWKEPFPNMLCNDSWLNAAPRDRSEIWICPH